MALKIDSEIEEKLTCAFKNGMKKIGKFSFTG